jgi:hypothetical protein
MRKIEKGDERKVGRRREIEYRKRLRIKEEERK